MKKVNLSGFPQLGIKHGYMRISFASGRRRAPAAALFHGDIGVARQCSSVQEILRGGRIFREFLNGLTN
jgi:hypothetical protein